MSNDSPLNSDLVQDSRLPTIFLPDGETKHTIWRSDKSGRRRRSRKDEIWRREPGRQIGSGSFGQVWLERSNTGRVRALKAIRKEPQFSAMSYARELEAAAKFSHDRYVDCFVKSYGWFEDEKKIYIAMEYLQHGDLGKHIVEEICESEAQDITCQLVQGLNHLHDNKFVHRDLKPQNILVVQPGPNWWVKIADLGLSKRVRENIDTGSTAIGTERYCAPEVLRVTAESSPNEEPLEQSHKAARDLWALGEVVFQILAKRPAFSSNYEVYRFAEGLETLERQSDSLRDMDLSVECVAFIGKLLIPDPKSRISAAEAVLDPWLLSVELCSPSTSRSSTPTMRESSPSRMLPSNPIVDTEANLSEGTRKGSCQWSTGLLDGAVDTPEVPVGPKPRPRTPDQRSRGHDSLERHSSGGEGPSPPRVKVIKRNVQAPAVGAPAKFVEHVESDLYGNRGGDRSDRYLRDFNPGHYLGCESATKHVSQGLDLRRTVKFGGDLAQGRFEETGEQRQQTPRRSRSVSILHTNVDEDGNRPLSSPVGTRSMVPTTITSARPGTGEHGQVYDPTNGPAQASAGPLGARTHSDDEQFHVPTPGAASRSFFCAHPRCTQNDPIALCQKRYAHAFGSLVGLMQHISEYHPAFSRGGPGEFLCAYPPHGGQQTQLASFASLRELLNHLTEFATHEQGETGPLFSWGYIATHWYDRPLHSYAEDYRIYVAAFPSMENMVSGHANQYARMAYGTTKYRVVDKKERLLVHGQFPQLLPHAKPPSTMPSTALIGEVYYRPQPPQPSLQRSSSARSLRPPPSPNYQVLPRPYVNALPGAQTPPPSGYPPSGGIPLPASQNYNQAMLTNALMRSHDYYLTPAPSASPGSSGAQSYRPQVLHQADARPLNHAGSAGLGQKRGSRSSSEVKPKVHQHTKPIPRLRQIGPEKGFGTLQERMQDTTLMDQSALRARASALQLEYEERNRQEIARVEADTKRLMRPRAKTRKTKPERHSRELPVVLRGDNFSIHLDPPEDGSNVVVTLDSARSIT